MLNIGITTRSFNGLSVSETAQRMQEVGFKCTELCFVHSDLGGWAYNGIGDLPGSHRRGDGKRQTNSVRAGSR